MIGKGNRRPKFCVFPGYNWCGPGCSGPAPPINEVDAACKAHDRCYCNSTDRYACDCDLMRDLEPYLHFNGEMGRRARSIHRYMKVQSFFRKGY